MSTAHLSLLADLVLLIHALFVGFVVLSLPLILIGGASGWQWVRNRAFRFTHLAAITFVVLQTWFDQICPLTRWENILRMQAGEAVYERGLIADFLHAVLFYRAPEWVFLMVYTIFGLAIVWAWWRVPPQTRKMRD